MIHAVTQYAQDVADGNIVAGLYVRLACKRHLDDLARQADEQFPFIFSEDKANDIIDFAECLRYTDGKKGFVNTQIELLMFAKFILGSIFGWVYKDTGYRRFTKAYIQVARKNIKSMLEAIINIYLCACDGHQNAQIYCTATKMKQARLVWEQAAKFIKQDPDFAKEFKIRNHDAEIEYLRSGGKIMALGRDTGSIDGFDPHGGTIDEYHAHSTNQMVKLLEDGAVNQDEYLISIITTAGFDLTSPCYEEYEYCCRFLETENYNDSYFVYIAQMDKDDDIWDPKNWIKCNPLVATLPTGIRNITKFAQEAKEKGGSELRNLMTKTFNIWVTYFDGQYIDMESWKKCGCDLTIEDMRGRECIAGLDLSSGGDLTTLTLEFVISKDDRRKYYIYSHSFIPSKRLHAHIKTDKAPYGEWKENELLTATETNDGIKNDYKFIIAHLEWLRKEYNLKCKAIAYDPHNADAFLNDLEALGVPLIEIKQSARELNSPTVDFELEVRAGNVMYDKKNKLLTWSMTNAVTESNSFGEIKVKKNLRTKRIDPVDAVIDAHKLAMTSDSYAVDINQFATEEYLDELWGDDYI